MEYWGRNLSCHIYDNSSWYFFLYVLASDSLEVKVGIFSSFFHSFLSPPSFSFLPSFLLSSFLPLSLLIYYHPSFLPLPPLLLIFLIFLFLFSSSSFFSSLYLKAQLWFNKQSLTATAYGRDTVICFSLVEPWTHVHRWNLKAPSFCPAFMLILWIFIF